MTAMRVPAIPPPRPQGAGLLGELHAALCRYVVLPSAEAADAVSLWVAASHAQPAWEHAPRLAVVSPLKRCGKSRLLDVVAETCHAPLITVNATIAAVVRSIGEDPPTLLVDEADTLWGSKKVADSNEDLRGLLNAGHQRNRPMLRWDVTTRTLDQLDTFAMALLAAIGELPDTIMDRAVVIRMRRRAPGEHVDPYRTRRDAPPLNQLRDRLTEWVRAHLDALRHATPPMPLEDRAADTWEPLVAVADLAGGDWPGRARAAATTLTAAEAQQEEDASASVRLLGDLREVFGDDDALYSTTILDRLHKLEDAPWGDWYGRLLTTRDLAKLLRPYQVRARNLREHGTGAPRKGYTRADLHEPWARYLPLPPLHPPHRDEAAGQPDQAHVADQLLPAATSATSPSPVADVADRLDASATGLTSHVADVADVAQPPSANGYGWRYDQHLAPCAACGTGTTNRAPSGRPSTSPAPTPSTRGSLAMTDITECHVIRREGAQPLPARSRAVPGRQRRPAGRRRPAHRPISPPFLRRLDGAAPRHPMPEVAPAMTYSHNDPHADLETDPEPDRANAVAPDPGRAHHPTGPPDTPDAPTDGDAGPTADKSDGEGRVLVDSPQAQPPRLTPATVRASQRQPIIPLWLRSRRELRAAAGWLAGHLAHTAAYHATRSPKYATRLLVRAPRGAVRLITGTLRWTLDTEGAPARQAALRREDTEQYLKLSQQRDARVRRRTMVTLTASIGVLLVLLLVLAAPGWVHWTVAAGLLVLLGVLGAPADRPLLDTAVVTPRAARLTSEVVVRALSVLGLAGITQALARNPRAVSFPAPITRDGPGWRADIDLPPGVTAAEVIDRRDKLASGLGRPLGCVWPEGNHEVSPGRLVLWVGDQDMAATRQPTWPLLRHGSVDVFQPFPFGTDPRGRTVQMELAYSNLLIGSIPGAGKTFTLRLPLLAAALDPRAELWTFELKGTGDLEAIARVAARYASGGDDDVVEQALLALRDLREQCSRRAAAIKQLPKHLCPENKVTPQLASNPYLGLRPLVVAIDECQELFTHPDLGKEAGDLAERIIKLGRALGIMLLLATQRPDARSLPTGVSANVGTRFCLRVMGQLENDMILGTSAYKNGVRATMFTARDKGVGYLVGGPDPDPQITRVFYVDNPATERVIARARAARHAAGTLTGHAAGQPPEAPAHRSDTLLADILAVIPPGEAKVWSETVLERLAALRPEVYGGLTRDQLTAALKPYGITTSQVWGTTPDGRGANRRGIDRQAVADAATHRDRRRAAGSPP